MENIDRNLPRAAATLGARPGHGVLEDLFPLSLPGVAAAAIMVFVTAIGFFIVPALLGGRRETMITQIIIDQVLQTLNWGFAGAISVLLLVVVLVGLRALRPVARPLDHDRRARPRDGEMATSPRAGLLAKARRSRS